MRLHEELKGQERISEDVATSPWHIHIRIYSSLYKTCVLKIPIV